MLEDARFAASSPVRQLSLMAEGPLRICLVIEAGGGGASRHVLDLAGELSRRGHLIHLLYSAVRAEARHLSEIADLNIVAQPVEMHRSLGLHDLRSAREVGAVIRAAGPFDIVHGHSSKAGAIARLAFAGKARRVYTPHAFRGLDPSGGIMARAVFNSAEIALGAWRTDALIAVSQEELEFAGRLHIADGKRHLIRNGVVHIPPTTREQARGRLGLSNDDVVIGFVGRLSYQKAPERFVEIMARLMREAPRVRAVLLGDGENADVVERGITTSGLADRFIWQRKAKAQELMPAFDAVMMTSRYEGLSYVLLESLAAKVPIITTQVAGAQDVIGTSGCGIIVANDDRVLERLEGAALSLATDPGLRTAMADAAARRSAEINGMRMIDETEQLYRQLVGLKR